MRTAARVDDNQGAIVKVLRKAGASVRSTAAIGKGFPDIVVGYKGINYLCEIKDGAKVKSAQKLTPDEQDFYESWKGQLWIIRNEQEALEMLSII